MTQQASAEEARKAYEAARAEADAVTITEDGLARARARIGVEVPIRRADWSVCSLDALYHYCQGLGDDNPLFWNEEYARQTRWGGVIAPHMFVTNMGTSRVRVLTKDGRPLTPEEREAGEHALAGLHGWYSGDDVEFFQPIRVGDSLTVKHYLKDLIVKRSEFAGTTVHRITRWEWVNQNGHLVAISDNLLISGGREANRGDRQKYAKEEPAIYTPKQIEEIAAACVQEVKNRRGAPPRYWEDVNVGDELPPIIKGPLTVSDMIAWNYGDGLTFIAGAHRIMMLDYSRHPLAYPITEQGIPDVVERVHWDNELGRRTGNPGAYDYGKQRVAWMGHLVTDWIGDDGWMRKLSVQFRRFNYLGDTTWCKGKVAEKVVENGEHRVTLDLWADDQRGRQTTIGKAVVQLPSRVDGPVKLPVITPDWW